MYSQCVRPTALASDSARLGVTTRCKVHVVGHEAIAVHLQAEPPRLLSQNRQVRLPIIIDEEHVLPVVPTLRHVMRTAGHHHSRCSPHATPLPTTRPPVKQKPVAVPG